MWIKPMAHNCMRLLYCWWPTYVKRDFIKDFLESSLYVRNIKKYAFQKYTTRILVRKGTLIMKLHKYRTIRRIMWESKIEISQQAPSSKALAISTESWDILGRNTDRDFTGDLSLKRGNLRMVFFSDESRLYEKHRIVYFSKIGQLGNIWRGGSQPPHLKL